MNAFLDKSKTLKTPTDEDINKNKGILLAEGVGSIGGTAVIVSSGRRSVAVETKYGFGAGLLARVDAKHHSNALNATEDELLKQQINDLKKPFYDKCINSFVI